jgi:hypothetical protein
MCSQDWWEAAAKAPFTTAVCDRITRLKTLLATLPPTIARVVFVCHENVIRLMTGVGHWLRFLAAPL